MKRIEKTIDIGKLRSLGPGLNIVVENRPGNRVRVELHDNKDISDPVIVRATRALCPDVIYVDCTIKLTELDEAV